MSVNAEFPYIQTINDIDTGIAAYAIQPISSVESSLLTEENPILAFGPLGAVNIFVGATNAGKSRFLRTLAKCETFGFYPSPEIYRELLDLFVCPAWLAQSEEIFEFRITQQGYTSYSSGRPVVLGGLPSWAQKILQYVEPQANYRVVFDAAFFRRTIPFFTKIALQKFKNSERKMDFISDDVDEQKAIDWTRKLFIGEVAARKHDQRKYGHMEGINAYHNQHIKFDLDSVSQTWQDYFYRLWAAVELFENDLPSEPFKPTQRFYIPTLRSAVSLRDELGKRLSYDVFEKTIRTNYRLDDLNLEIFTGNQLYNTLKRDRNGSPEVVNRLRDFEKFLGNAFYEGRQVEVVALDEHFEEGQHISVRVQGETHRELHDLGDGINTLIILLYQLFMAKPGSWLFIEEPELNLHPGLQRIFLQTLIENEALRKKNLRVFFTTHSNHLLRMTLRDGTIASNDISVFAFQQRATDKDSFLIRPLVSEHHAALALLGVQNASVLLAQCGIWVEGVTDRQYLRAYLNAYQDSDGFHKSQQRTMREDTHFAFWEYAGSNLSHYLMSSVPYKNSPEAEEYERGKKDVLDKIQSSALCNRIFLLADRDRKKSKKHEALKSLAKEQSNFVYHVTPCIEVENLLSPREINACLPAFLRKQSFSLVSFTQPEYRDVRIGEFLRQKLQNDFPDNWVAASGTLTTDRKNRLCELAVQHVSWDSMSKDAKVLAKALYDFILKHNDI